MISWLLAHHASSQVPYELIALVSPWIQLALLVSFMLGLMVTD